MISFDWDRCGGYGQGDWFRKKVKSVNDRVVEIRTDLQSTLDRTRRNIATFGKLQTSKRNDHQRLMLTCVLKYNTDNLLFELNEKVWYMGVLKNNIDVLLELDKTSESDKGAMRTELDRSKSELDALVKDRNAMQEALKQTRRDISDVAEGRETMQELLAKKEMTIVNLADLKKDKEILQVAIHEKSSSMGFLSLPLRTFLSRSITFSAYMQEDIDVLRDKLRRKEKAIAILENNIDFLQVELRRRTDMYDDEYDYFGSIFTRSGWSARYIVTSDYMQTFELANDWSALRVKRDRIWNLQGKLLYYRIHAPFQPRGGTDELLKATEDVRVKLDRKRRLQIELGKDTTAVRFKLYQIRMDMTAGGAQAVCAGIVVAADGVQAVYAGMVIDSVLRYHIIKEEMEIRVNTIHVTFGGKPTSKDVQSYKTSVSFGDMSAEVLERQNFEKQSEEEEKEEEEEFRAVEEMLMCKVCLDEDLCIIFLPCSHLATCERCASVLHSCPVCRSPINESLKVNFE